MNGRIKYLLLLLLRDLIASTLILEEKIEKTCNLIESEIVLNKLTIFYLLRGASLQPFVYISFVLEFVLLPSFISCCMGVIVSVYYGKLRICAMKIFDAIKNIAIVIRYGYDERHKKWKLFAITVIFLCQLHQLGALLLLLYICANS